MVEIREILCPIDFSETSRHALEHAVAMAKWYTARLTAIHVLTAPFPQPPILFASFPTTPPAPADRHAFESDLRAWLEPASRSGVATDVVIDEGSPARQILGQASARNADLIVMGTHGRTGFDRFVPPHPPHFTRSLRREQLHLKRLRVAGVTRRRDDGGSRGIRAGWCGMPSIRTTRVDAATAGRRD